MIPISEHMQQLEEWEAMPLAQPIHRTLVDVLRAVLAIAASGSSMGPQDLHKDCPELHKRCKTVTKTFLSALSLVDMADNECSL